MSEIFIEHKMRLKFNYSACRDAYHRCKKAIAAEDDAEIYASIGELLLWVKRRIATCTLSRWIIPLPPQFISSWDRPGFISH